MKLFKHALAALAALCLGVGGPAFAADNYDVTVGSGKTMACKDIAAVCFVKHLLFDSGGAEMADTTLHAVKTAEQTLYTVTVAQGVTTPRTTLYTINTAWANSATVPTSGGFTFTNACRTSGGHARMTALTVTSSLDPALLLQGELYLFDSAVTEINDNATFSISDADILKLVPGGVIPFQMQTSNAGSGTNSFFSLPNLAVDFTCNGTRNLRFLIKVKNAYVPTSDVLTFNATFVALD